ncbi:TetR/AcrR family transcriptional regulator [Planotetraspora kaengkrachanensis]|uniref:TetR family transcriptional regulator n=1 Tax=Planotetraspora kaengkrachanensis TaxID=575193 RepID=A0A8J3PSQ7_9ACTN|nr:TetR family transcriptional regulator [Planotetraspora kaengkrachanensis]GIG78536.1 TetR family transcriptional regulator [Planotetraspora kaengkrachanensis]
MDSKSGRRPGSPQTREAILEAAVEAFTEGGYAGTTIRAVARTAGVDPALVMHFFGNKDGLFDAAIRASGLPLRELGEVMEGDIEGVGERLVRRYLSLWESPEHGPKLRAVVSSAASSPAAAAMLKEFITNEVLQPLAGQLGVDQAETRGIIAGSHLIGIAFTRYVLNIGPVASLEKEQLVACVAPAVQRYLTGDLPLA